MSGAHDMQVAMREAGFIHAPLPKPGELLRMPDIDKKPGNQSGYCKLFADGCGGFYGGWSSGYSATYQAESDRPLTRAEQERYRREIEHARLQRAKELQTTRRQAAKEAQKQWEAAQPEPGTHKYLHTKQIEPHGIRSNGFLLLVPVHDIHGNWQSLQTIDPRGNKRFIAGGQISGGMYRIGDVDPAGTICICEGFATGATLFEEGGNPVVVAFNAGNLKPVAQAIRGRYPKADIVICADNDRFTEGNPGVTKAKAAAQAVGARLAIPEFADDEPGTDWNDWHLMWRQRVVA